MFKYLLEIGTAQRACTTRLLAAPLVIGALVGPMAMGCQTRQTPPPPVDDTRANSAPADPATPSHGISTTAKVAVLAGAAALYYMYKHHQTAGAETGENSQYYLSKNGRVYYRDAEHRAHWVTPPPQGIQVPEAEAAAYQGFQGYNNNASGRDLSGLGTDTDGQ